MQVNKNEDPQVFASRNTVRVNAGRKCVDGRYLPTQSRGLLARPGGDLGYALALLAVNKKKNLGLTPEQCVNVIYKVVTKNSGKFSMHTDTHCDPDPQTQVGLIGCGHLAKAANNMLCEAYNVNGDEVVTMVTYARNLAEIEKNVEVVNLKGDHEEAGVLVIKSDTYTVHAYDPKMKKMYFIYDEKRDNTFLKKLVTTLKIKGVTYEDLKKEADIQLQATLGNLAKGLPVYAVAFKGKIPRITHMGTV